ncbi:unnamed protein product [Gordionus sp. m RMFG-2023]
MNSKRCSSSQSSIVIPFRSPTPISPSCMSSPTPGFHPDPSWFPPPVMSCYNSGKPGHMLRECREAKCFGYGKLGHTAPYCPNKQERSRCADCGRFGHNKGECNTSNYNNKSGFPQREIGPSASNVRTTERVESSREEQLGTNGQTMRDRRSEVREEENAEEPEVNGERVQLALEQMRGAVVETMTDPDESLAWEELMQLGEIGVGERNGMTMEDWELEHLLEFILSEDEDEDDGDSGFM